MSEVPLYTGFSKTMARTVRAGCWVLGSNLPLAYGVVHLIIIIKEISLSRNPPYQGTLVFQRQGCRLGQTLFLGLPRADDVSFERVDRAFSVKRQHTHTHVPLSSRGMPGSYGATLTSNTAFSIGGTP